MVIISWWTGRPWKVNINKLSIKLFSLFCLFSFIFRAVPEGAGGSYYACAWFYSCWWPTSFSSIFFKVKPKKRGKTILHQRHQLPPGQTQKLFWPQRDVCCLPSLDQWVLGISSIWGIARRGKLGESFSSRKGIFKAFCRSLASYLEAVISDCLTNSFGKHRGQFRSEKSYPPSLILRCCWQRPPHSLSPMSLINETVTVLWMKSKRKHGFGELRLGDQCGISIENLNDLSPFLPKIYS